MEVEAAKMGSIVSCGKAAWPPFPLIIALKLPHPAKNSPDRDAATPLGYLWTRCSPKMALIFSRTLSLIMSFAPSPRSSAG